VTASTVFDGPDSLLDAVGSTFGPTDWLTIEQSRIDAFAEATGDHQWIHVDVERAKDGPYGGTIAHGYLTLSLTNLFLPQLIEVQGVSAGINYGLDRLRFPAAVPSGSRIRARAELMSAAPIEGGVATTVRVTVELEGNDRPCCVADSLSRFLR
jgi:acyl dehydratase